MHRHEGLYLAFYPVEKKGLSQYIPGFTRRVRKYEYMHNMAHWCLTANYDVSVLGKASQAQTYRTVGRVLRTTVLH